MPFNLTVPVTPPATGDHHVVLADGTALAFGVAAGQDYAVGRVRGEMGGLNVGLIPLTGRGRTKAPLELTALLDPYPPRTLEARRRRLADALGGARELWRPDGLYLPLWYAQADPDVPGADELPVVFKPKTHDWRYPASDDAALSGAAPTVESRPHAPVYAFSGASSLAAPLLSARLPTGTLAFGAKVAERGVFDLLSLGRGVDAAGARSDTGAHYATDRYVFGAGGGRLEVPETDAVLFGFLGLWAFAWAENGQGWAYSLSALGFRAHGPFAVGPVAEMAVPRLSAGVRTDDTGLEGWLLLGSAAAGAPAFTHRTLSQAQARRGLEAWWAELNRVPLTFDLPPAPLGVTLAVPAVPELVAGQSVTVTVVIGRLGGLVDPVELVATSDDPDMAVSALPASNDEDGGSDAWAVTLRPAEGIVTGDAQARVTVRFAARPVDRADPRLAGVGATAEATAVVVAAAPTLGTAVRGVWRFSSAGHNFAELAADASGAGRSVTLKGLAHWSSRSDAVYVTGNDEEPFGKAAAYVEGALAELNASHTVTLHAVRLRDSAPGTVVVCMASGANNADWWYLYVAAGTLKLRASGAAGTADSAGALALSAEELTPVAVVLDRAANTLYAFDPRNPAAKVSVAAPAWAGTGRLCWGSRVQTGGAVAVTSRVLVCNTVLNAAALSDVRAERQLAAEAGHAKRRPEDARAEYPEEVAYIFEANEGGYPRNRHPATAGETLVASGSGATGSGGELRTSGAAGSMWHTPWLAGVHTSRAFEVVALLKDAHLDPGGNKPKLSIACQDSLAMQLRLGASTDTDTSRRRFIAGVFAGSATGMSQTLTTLGGLLQPRTYAVTVDKPNNRMTFTNVDTGAAEAYSFGPLDWTGRVNVGFGGINRGLNSGSTTVYRGIEGENASKTLGCVIAVRPLTPAKRSAVQANLSGTFTAVSPTAPTTPPPTTTPGDTGGATVPAGTPYLRSASFNANNLGLEARQYRASIFGAHAAGTLTKESMTGIFSVNYPDKIDLYGLRWPKRLANSLRACLRLTGDPAILPILYSLVEPLLTRFETGWVGWPADKPIPNGWWSTTDRRSYHKKEDDRKAAADPDYVRRERPGFKRFLYLNEGASDHDHYGAHLHWLDNLLGHGWMFWTACVLDINRDADPKYATAADTLYDYAFNHWEKLVNFEVSRHSLHGYLKVNKALYHAHAAHTAIYECFELWQSLPHRLGAPRAQDTAARKAMMRHILDGFVTYNFPAGMPQAANSETYQFLNYEHQNNVYRTEAAIGNADDNAGDTTYDSEFGSEIINFYLNGTADGSGRKLTRGHIAALSNTYGWIVEKAQPGPKYDINVSNTVAATSGTGDYVLFNNGLYIASRFGGGQRPHYTNMARDANGNLINLNGFTRLGMMGGFYHWADPTAEAYNRVQWLRRGRYNYSSGTRVKPGDLVQNPAHSSRSQWTWTLPFYLHALLAPDKPLANIDVGTYGFF